MRPPRALHRRIVPKAVESPLLLYIDIPYVQAYNFGQSEAAPKCKLVDERCF